jgi:two-component system, cell cycle sensor histidine kinase and response regulator CckA
MARRRGSEQTQEARTETCASPPTILVVDHLDAIRAIVREFLETEGFTVLLAKSASHATRILRGHSGTIDLLLTELQMPGTDGVLLAKRLQALRPEMAVVTMSAALSSAVTRKQISLIAAQFLWKPFTKQELLKKLDESLQRNHDRPSIAPKKRSSLSPV